MSKSLSNKKKKEIKKTTSSPSSILSSSANVLSGKVSSLIYSNNTNSSPKVSNQNNYASSKNTYNSVVSPLSVLNTNPNSSSKSPSLKNKPYFNFQALSNRLNRFTNK